MRISVLNGSFGAPYRFPMQKGLDMSNPELKMHSPLKSQKSFGSQNGNPYYVERAKKREKKKRAVLSVMSLARAHFKCRG